jgi:hypothetical protein
MKGLFPLPPATGNLSSREQLILDLLTANPEGLRSSDLGAHIHQATDSPCPCSDTVRCKWSRAEGERIGRMLRRRDLAIKRKTGRWQLTRPPVQGYDPSTAPLPDGF